MSSYPYNSTSELRQKMTGLRRQLSHPHLNKFKEAKKELASIYEDILSYVSESHKFTREQSEEERFARLIGQGVHAEVEHHLQKIRNIQEIIARNQMKCAFFGRTSNGKSTVINAMLGSKLLPSGLGHTTSCFLEIQGTDQDSGYLLMSDSDTNPKETSDISHQARPIDSVGQLAHALSSVKLSTDTLLKIFWPSSYCRLLREDVVLLDSPGINVDPDMDRWIDLHCLDADVFILVANAESTLMQAEKDFFHKVSQKLSKPNIFIINNRWDASANEIEYINEVREQHLQRCVAFLVDELKVCTRTEAEGHVFFVSAREVLAMRTKANLGGDPHSGPPGAATSIGSPLSAVAYMAEGWQDRLVEFTNFETVFEKNLSESATRTKFAAHSEQGKDVVNRVRTIMENIYETTVEEKDAAVRCRRLSQAHLEEVRARLMKTTQAVDEMLHASLARVEAQVASALNAEIRRLSELVDSYSRPFHPDPALIHVYKRELNTHVERELGRKLTEACSSDILNEVARCEQLMMNKHAAIVSDEACKNRILQLVDPTAFTPEFHLDCRNLCANFHEDIQFRFSLSLGTLFQRLSAPRRSTNSYHWTQSDGIPSSLVNSSILPRSSLTVDLFPSLMSRGAVGTVIAFGIMSKAVGWRVLAVACGIYGGLYLYERLSWTNKAKETAFKRQYVDFASHKLRLIVDLTSTNARHQAKRELHLAHKKLSTEVENFIDTLVEEVKQLDSDINRLDFITTEARKLKNRANNLGNILNKFHETFILNPWDESN
ncbi:unnamed protein product [Schistosoma haematobium]|nr:unnamed protein product [Schistosoma haematobium]